MKLKRLYIRRMYSELGLELREFSEGVSLFIGPNGSGKTTACRSIQGLLWPDTLKDATYPELFSEWLTDDGRLLSIERQGTERRFIENGKPATPPTLPPAHLASCFTITLDDLFDGTSDQLAAAVEQDMAGGFDLRKLRQAEAIQFRSRKALETKREFEEAERRVRKISEAQAALQREYGELAALEERQERSERAYSDLGRLENALQRRQLLEEQEQQERVLAQFPSRMKLLQGGELQRLEDLKRREKQLEKERADAESAKAAAQARLAQSGLPPGGWTRREQAEYQERVRKLEQTERRIGELEAQLQGAEERKNRARGNIFHAGDEEKLLQLSVPAIEELQAFHRQSEQITLRGQAVRTELSILESELKKAEPTELHSLQEGASLLRTWLRHGGGEYKRTAKQLHTLASLAALLCIALAGTLALAVHPLFWAVLPLALLILGFSIRKYRHSAVEAPDNKRIESAFERLKINSLESWSSEAVLDCLSSLEQRLDFLRLSQAQEVRVKERRALLAELQLEEARLEEARREIAARLGLAPESGEFALVRLGEALNAFQDAALAFHQLERELSAVRSGHREQLENLNALFTRFDLGCVCNYSEAIAALDELGRRLERFSEAQNELAAAEQRLEHNALHHAESTEDLRHFYLRLELELGDEEQLRDLCRQREKYEETLQHCAHLRRDITGIEQKLEVEAPQYLSLDKKELTELHEEAQRLISERAELNHRLHELRLRIASTRDAMSLEKAEHARRVQSERLQAAYRQALIGASAEMLLDEVEQEYRQNRLPAVFREADRLFSLFTRGRYRLLPAGGSEDAQEFGAEDQSSGAVLTLSRLSRGTRTQLLLAARIAFAREHEGRSVLPIVLDEVLGSSDPARFHAIASALLLLAREGRQIIYFSCQPTDVVLWRKAAESIGVTPPQITNLGGDTRDKFSETLLEAGLRALPNVREPNGEAYEDYVRRLGDVPAINIEDGADGAHLAHLLNDTDTLYRLLRSDIKTYGQLRCLWEQNSLGDLLERTEFERVKAQALLIDTTCECARIGKGPKLTPEKLVEMFSSPRFESAVLKLNEELGYDARRLLAAIDPNGEKRLRNFRKDTYEKFREELIVNGYLPTEALLTREEAQARVLASLTSFLKNGVLTQEEANGMFLLLWEEFNSSVEDNDLELEQAVG